MEQVAQSRNLCDKGRFDKEWLSAVCVILLLMIGVPTIVYAAQSSAQSGTQTRDPYDYFFNQSFNNLQDEAETAREEGKAGILVMFSDPDCPWCAKMRATVMNQVPIQEYFRKHFRILDMDTRGDTTMVDFNGKEMAEKDFSLKVNRVRGTPVFIFYDLEGNKLLRYTGATRTAQEFMWMGQYIVEGAYKNKKFSKYKRERLAKRDE